MTITPEQKQLLSQHLSLVIEANKTTNITRIADGEQGWLLHVEDSLVGVPEVDEAPAGKLADLGSGAGYPGIPLAVVTDRRVTLVESVGKKAALLEGFAKDLGLQNTVDVFAGRAEELARQRHGQYAVITARALSSLPSLMELASPLLIQGGRLVCYKSVDIEDELVAAKRVQKVLAMRLVGKRDTVLQDGKTPRSIVVFEKTGKPLVKLPRREGLAQRKPYKN